MAGRGECQAFLRFAGFTGLIHGFTRPPIRTTNLYLLDFIYAYDSRPNIKQVVMGYTGYMSHYRPPASA